MEAILLKILEKESTIIIPNLGAIIKIGDIYQFNRFLKYNDGKLEGFIASELKLDSDASKEKITIFLKEINDSFDKTNKHDLKGIGILEKSGENISFIKGSATIKTSSNVSSVVTEKKSPEEKPKVKETPKEVKIKEVEPIVKEKETLQKGETKTTNDSKPTVEVVKEEPKKEKLSKLEEIKKEIKKQDSKKAVVNKESKVAKPVVTKKEDKKEPKEVKNEKPTIPAQSLSSLKEVSFFELLKDKKGEKYKSSTASVVSKVSEPAKIDSKKKETKPAKEEVKPIATKKEDKTVSKEVKNEKATISAQSSASLKEVSFFELLKDKKGEKYKSSTASVVSSASQPTKIDSKKKESKPSKEVAKEDKNVSVTTKTPVGKEEPVKAVIAEPVKVDSKETKSVKTEKETKIVTTEAATSNGKNIKKKEDPIVKKETKRKKKAPVFLIILLLLLLLLGGAGFYFKNYVTGYYHSFKTYIAGDSSYKEAKDLSADGSKHDIEEEKDKLHEKTIGSTVVSKEDINTVEEDYIGDSKVEGEGHEEALKVTKEKPSVAEQSNDLPKDKLEEVKEQPKKEVKEEVVPETIVEEKVTPKVEETKIEEEVELPVETKSNSSESSELISQLKNKIEELKKKLEESLKTNAKNEALISDLKSQIASLKGKISSQSSSSNVSSTSSSSTTNGRYKVITGSFSKRRYADRKVANLKENGYPDSYVVGKFGGLYVVSIGDFDSKPDAISFKDKYKSSGGSCFVKKI